MGYRVFGGFSTLAAGIIFFGLVMDYYNPKQEDLQEIDVTENLDIGFSGPNGSGKITELSDHLQPENPETAALENVLEYSIYPTENLSNGQEVQITVSWNDMTAASNHLKPVNETCTVIVSGLDDSVEDQSSF